MILSGKKFLLLILYAPTRKDNYNEPISGRTRLMKMIFLFDKELRKDFEKDKNFEKIELPEFFAWKYGPFSTGVFNDLEFLSNQGYITKTAGEVSPIFPEIEEYKYWIEDADDFEPIEFSEDKYLLTNDKGIPKAKELWTALTINQIELLVNFKDILNHSSLERILEYVYKKYEKEGYVTKSLIKDRFF
jgi:uncharacterized protein